MAINTFFPCNYRYPYTNDHELNLGWVLATIKAQESELSKFVALNTVKYADPFDWNITTQYATNTVVFNPSDMTAYLSVQPVPSGVQIDNTDYWTPIFTLADIFTAYKTSITPVEQIAAKPATQAINKGQLLWIDNMLYEAVRDISQGTVIVPGENVVTTNISDELADQEQTFQQLQQNIQAEQTAREHADQQLQQNIQAEQSARERADTELQENITAEQTAREQADATLQSNINNLANKLPSLKIAVNSFYYYVDGVNGSDANDGLTTETAFKTLDKIIELINGGAIDIRCQIISSGTYTIGGDINAFTGISWHLNAAENVKATVVFSRADHSIAFYHCHLNFQNLSFANTNKQLGARFYVEGGDAGISNCDFSGFQKFAVESGFFAIENITVDRLQLRKCHGYLNGLTIKNTAMGNNDFAVEIQHAGPMRLYGNLNVQDPGAVGDANNALFNVVFSTVNLMFTHSFASTTNKYQYAIWSVNSIIYVTDNRENGLAANSVAGNSYSNVLKIKTNQTVDIFQQPTTGTVRYSGGKLQYYDGSSWKNVSG